MAKVVIYPIPNNQINIVYSVGTLPIEEIAKKDVPKDVPYLIIDDSELPADRTYRAAWDADFSKPDGVGLGHDAWFQQSEDNLSKILGVPND